MKKTLNLILILILPVVIAMGASGCLNEKGLETLETTDSKTYLCTSAPRYSDMGSAIFPIAEKYKNINFLGQLFTAYDCGEKRMNEFFSIKEKKYILGSTLWLSTNPPEKLVNTFKQIGYVCVEDKSVESSCKKWRLNDEVDIDKIIKLKEFIKYIELDDCVNCG